MAKIVFPGVTTPSLTFRWSILDCTPGAAWSYQMYKAGVPYGSAVSGAVGGDGTYSALIAPVALGEYEVLFSIGGQEIIVPLQSIATLDFVWRPDFQSSASKKTDVRETKFGDGYLQTVPMGLNSVMADWSLQFTELNDVEAMQIDYFLASMKGASAFFWKDATGKRLKFRCPEWSTTYQDDQQNSISARFVQVFL